MRTNVVIDDDLLAEAMRYTGLKTKKAVIDEALTTLIRLRRQGQIRLLRVQLRWEGDLAAMREGRLVAETAIPYADTEKSGDGDVDR